MNNGSALGTPQPISKIIAESGSALQQVKRGRGRPPKSASTPQPGNASVSAGTNPSPLPVAQPVEIPAQALKPLLQLPFKLAVAKTGYPGWALEDEEAEGLAPSLDLVLKQYMPLAGGPHAALVTFSVSFLMVTTMKYLSYAEWKRSIDLIKNKEAREDKIA